MTIGELAAETDVPATTIRYWERIGVLPKPPRASGQRRYLPDAVHRIAVLRLARACGFRLDEMRHLMNGFDSSVSASNRWQVLTQKKAHELDVQLAQLKAMRQLVNRVGRCQCADLSDCGRLAGSVLATVTK